MVKVKEFFSKKDVTPAVLVIDIYVNNVIPNICSYYCFVPGSGETLNMGGGVILSGN